jgi:hypothetical protein
MLKQRKSREAAKSHMLDMICEKLRLRGRVDHPTASGGQSRPE